MSSKRSKGSPDGAHMMTDEMLLAILSRLPTKSLRRFRCVSMAWNLHITHVFSLRKLLPISGFFVPREGYYIPISPDQQLYGEGFQSRLKSLPFHSLCVVHSCNGLILLTRLMNDTSVRFLYVWNPATMEFVALPDGLTEKYSLTDCFLAYNPCESPHYNVVQFTVKRRSYVIVEIYSSMTRGWSKIIVRSENRLSDLGWYNLSAFHDGALYLLPIDRFDRLTRFDIQKEAFYFLDFPENRPRFTVQYECIGVSRGHLHYAVHFGHQFELKIYILEKDDGYTSKWLLLHKINTKNEIPARNFQFLAFHPESEVIYLHIPRKILAYHLYSGKLEGVQVIDAKCMVDPTRVLLVIPCLESINPPGGKFIKPLLLRKTTGLHTPLSEINSSSRVPQPNAADPITDHGLQVAIKASVQSPAEPQLVVSAIKLNKEIVSSPNPSPQENQDSAEISGERCMRQPALEKLVSVSRDSLAGKSIEVTSDISVTSGVIRPCSHSQLLTPSLAELEELLIELNGNALIPSLRPGQMEKSEDELSEEWADVCSHVFSITSYLTMVKANVKGEKLASRLENLKALKNSFDCSTLIRFLDCFLDYVQIIEKNNLDRIESNLRNGYFSKYRLHEEKKKEIAHKATLIQTTASETTGIIIDLEHGIKNTRDRITDLRNRLAKEEIKLSNMYTTLEVRKQEEAGLVDEKAFIASEQAVLELQGKELEDYRVNIPAEAEFSMEKIRGLVKQLTISLSKFDLMGSSYSWKKE